MAEGVAAVDQVSLSPGGQLLGGSVPFISDRRSDNPECNGRRIDLAFSCFFSERRSSSHRLTRRADENNAVAKGLERSSCFSQAPNVVVVDGLDQSGEGRQAWVWRSGGIIAWADIVALVGRRYHCHVDLLVSARGCSWVRAVLPGASRSRSLERGGPARLPRSLWRVGVFTRPPPAPARGRPR